MAQISVEITRLPGSVPGGNQQLADQILTSARREWLVHSAIEEHQRQEDQEEEEQRHAEEERRAQQSRRPENDRGLHRAAIEQAHLEPPRPSTEMERQKALTELHRWLAVGAPDPLEILVDDGVFSVEPLLWRTAALADLAPWNAGPHSPGRREPPYLAIVSLGQFRALGYVKPYFLADGLTPQGQRVLGGEAVNAILHSFRNIFLKRVLAEAGIPVDMPPREDWAEEAKALLDQRWHHVTKV